MDLENFKSKLDKDVDRLESKLLEKKPWYLHGEVSAKDRSENALLAEHFEVQRNAIFKPEPLEPKLIFDLLAIKIKEQIFNGPEPRVKSQVKTKSASKPFTSTTKRSLIEEYENLYVRARALEASQEDPEKEQLRLNIVSLFDSLDALSNMHFVPKKRVDGYNILTNKQSIALEEAGPTALAEADLLAPEEILEPRGEPLKGASEVTSTDKRRHRKKLMRVRAGRRKLRVALAIKTNDQKAALEKVVKLAHKPGSNIKIV
nr:U3 small nucleolar ribonucleoprotein [Hymenolepis microstoma]